MEVTGIGGEGLVWKRKTYPMKGKRNRKGIRTSSTRHTKCKKDKIEWDKNGQWSRTSV